MDETPLSLTLSPCRSGFEAAVLMLMMLGSQMPMEDDEPIRAGEGWDLLAGAVRDAAPPRSDREPGAVRLAAVEPGGG